MSINTKPVFLLDIDGVINAISQTKPKTFPDETWRHIKVSAIGQQWPILYSTEVVDRINALSDKVEVRWHTTWQFNAPRLGKAVGLNEFPVAWDYAEYKKTHGSQKFGSWLPDDDAYLWWKMHHAVDVVNLEQRPLIWTDDDIGQWEREIFLKDTQGAPNRRFCLSTPHTDTGLRPEELDTLEQFVEENA